MIDIMENKIIGPAIRKGRQLGMTEVITGQFEVKFGTLTEEIAAKLDGASEDNLMRWGWRVLTASSIGEVFAAA